MAFDRRFAHTCPPITETFWTGPFAPVRVETFNRPLPATNSSQLWQWVLQRLVVEIRRRCRNASRSLHPRFWDVYGAWVKVTMVEPSASIVVRSEHHFIRHLANPLIDERQALRLHLYEVLEDGFNYIKEFRQKPVAAPKGAPTRKPTIWPEEGMLACHPLSPRDRYGQYLGFVELRTHSEENDAAPLALGLLVPPRRYRLDPRAYILTGDYSAIFGGPPFASTVYCQHDPKTSGAFCAQAATIMSLGMLADRGARVEGSYALTYLGNRLAQRVGVPDELELARARSDVPPDCVDQMANRSAIREAFRPSGLVPSVCGKILQGLGNIPTAADGPGDSTVTTREAYSFRVSPGFTRLEISRPPSDHLLRRRLGDDFYDRLAKRLVQAYLAARFPVIWFVNGNDWWKDLPNPPSLAPHKAGHAVTLVGIRRWGASSDVSRPAAADHAEPPATGRLNPDAYSWIAHDPGHEPFFERPIDDCVDAAWSYPRADAKGCVLQPDHGQAVLQFTGIADERIKTHPFACLDYLAVLTTDPTVLGASRTAHSNHFRQYAAVTATRDFRARLVHRDDLSATLGPELTAEQRIALGSNYGSMPRERYWCVVGLQSSRPADIWAFPAERSPAPGAGAVTPAPEPYWFDAAGCRWQNPADQGRPHHRPTYPPISDPQSAGRAELQPSVLTSCYPRNLPTLFAEVQAVDNVSLFDLFVVRETDLIAYYRWQLQKNPGDDLFSRCATPTGLFGDPDAKRMSDTRGWIAEWIREQCAPFPNVRFAALATYFPDLTSWRAGDREMARRAVAQTVLLALDLGELVPRPIVEIVCGGIIDRCACADCKGDEPRCFVSSDEGKQRLLVDQLERVVIDVLSEKPTARFAIGLELEPGETYILRDATTMFSVLELIGRRTFNHPVTQSRVGLSQFVGLNADLAHLMSSGVHPNDLQRVMPQIVHAHISDLPGIHSRDQVPTSWTPREYTDEQRSHPCADYRPYLSVLARRAAQFAQQGTDGLLFSTACALELEGCGRIDWIHHGLSAMKQLLVEPERR